MRAHLRYDDRQREHGRNPKPARHVSEFGAVTFAASLGFERHAADRTTAGTDLPDLRVHRAGIDRAFWRYGCGRPRGHSVKVFLRIGNELAAATSATKEKGAAVVGVMVRRFCGIDFHPANWIDRGRISVVRMNRMLHHYRLETATP